MATAAPPPAGRSRRQEVWSRWRGHGERTWASAQLRFPVITELTARLLSVNVLDAATRLAAQLFLTAVPLVFVAAAVMPDSVRDQLVTSTRDLFGLTGASEQQLREVYGSGGSHEGVRGTTGVIGAVVVLLSATASSRAMARVCERAWLLPRTGVRVAVWRWFVWLVAWGTVLVLQGPLRKGFGAGPLLGVPLIFLADVAVWWYSQRLLLGARVPWLRLLPGALLTSAAMTSLSVTARFYMPIALNRSIATYGSLGSVFTLLSWLIACCAVITFTLTAGAVLATQPPLGPVLDRNRFLQET